MLVTDLLSGFDPCSVLTLQNNAFYPRACLSNTPGEFKGYLAMQEVVIIAPLS